jgi:hypothetical protein
MCQSALGLVEDADADDDNDGLSDQYEIAHGLDPRDPADAAEHLRLKAGRQGVMGIIQLILN